MRSLLFLSSLFFALQYSACAYDEINLGGGGTACDSLGNVTYDNQIKPIVDASCAYAGCHQPGGVGTGDYRTYAGMLSHLQSGSVADRVLAQKNDPSLGMPPNKSAYMESVKDDLTDEELLLFQCWLNAGFPEN